MPARNVNLTASGQAKLEWLRAAAKEGVDAAERGDSVALSSEREISRFLRKIRDELNEGDQILVKVLALEGNKIKLSRKAILMEQRSKLKGGE